jgi:transposase-like protein
MDKSYSISIGPLRPKGLEVTAAEKAEWVRRFEQSGVGLREFSAQYGLRVASLRNWRVKYAQAICGQARRDFVEVQLPALRTPAWSVELVLGNGKVLRLNGEVPEGLLEQVLRVC